MSLALVRHGRTDWNRRRRMQGASDVPLDDHGREQAAAAGRVLALAVWDRIVSSPLTRAQESAEIVAAHLGIEVSGTDVRLVERDYGEAEGLAVAEVQERWPDQAYPGSEPVAEVAARGVHALRELLDDGRNAVVVAHGTTLRLSIEALTGEACPRIHNGEIVMLEGDTRAPRARRLTG
ncbi:histidine phosphatase family protein [Microbacterium suaedae]|uniref:histidine phosphatase family protein n=1 Tax=Microbacterium suaedae TaxID=2067813 RepID=UPI000DA12E13|nr:histidine phosphatase family protein [Microbacterium suaedae]